MGVLTIEHPPEVTLCLRDRTSYSVGVLLIGTYRVRHPISNRVPTEVGV